MFLLGQHIQHHIGHAHLLWVSGVPQPLPPHSTCPAQHPQAEGLFRSPDPRADEVIHGRRREI